MKRKFLVLTVLLFSVAGIFAAPDTSLIEAAKNGDYPKFEQLVKKGAKLDEVDKRGMTLQCALAYFSDEDFAKACELLNKKKFNFNKTTSEGVTLAYVLSYSYSYNKLETLLKYKPDLTVKTDTELTPIDATQFGTFKFYSEQKMDDDIFEKAETVRKLLVENGSPEFNKLPMSVYYFGNYLYCFYNFMRKLIPFLNIDYLNRHDFYIFETVNGQDWASVNKEKCKKILQVNEFNNEIEEYYGTDEIVKVLDMIANSESGYCVFGYTGNNPVIPYQWVFIKGPEGDSFSESAYVKSFCTDSTYDFVQYKVSDFSMIVTIKFTE